MSAPLISVPLRVESQIVGIDSSCVIHPFYIHKMDSGPMRLMTIAHAFNYRIAVLREGGTVDRLSGTVQKSGNMFFKGRKYFMGQQVVVMFQIVSTLMEEVPAFALRMRELRGEQPNVQLIDNPWGHVEDCVATCNCLDCFSFVSSRATFNASPFKCANNCNAAVSSGQPFDFTMACTM